MPEGGLHALIGPNDAGKTTAVRAIMGLNAPRGGKVVFRGAAVAVLAPERIPRLGIADRQHVPEKGRTVWAGDGAALAAEGERVRGWLGV